MSRHLRSQWTTFARLWRGIWAKYAGRTESSSLQGGTAPEAPEQKSQRPGPSDYLFSSSSTPMGPRSSVKPITSDGWYLEGRPYKTFENRTAEVDRMIADHGNPEFDVDRPRKFHVDGSLRSNRPYKWGAEWGKEIRITDPTTGAMKGRKDVELFTAPPHGLQEYGRVCSYGSNRKYAPNNWRLGFAWSLSANALLRHYLAWAGGEDKDAESGLHHLAHAAWHCLVLVQYSIDHPEKDDRFGGPACPATVAK